MRKILATFINESRLFAKDLAGMALLFLMPLALTVLMALIQDAPFREYQDIRFEILWVDEDGGKMARQLGAELDSIPQFVLIRKLNDQLLTADKAQELVHKGNYKLAVIVPKGVSAEVANSANQVANELGAKLGAPGKLPQRESRQVALEIYFDPVIKQAMKLSLLNALEKQVTRIQAEIILARLENRLDEQAADSSGPGLRLQEKLQAVQIREISSGQHATAELTTNSVQHNVPAWALFGLFFIIIPIAGNFIREREDGSLMRIKMIPGSYFTILLGKLGFYIVLGMLQFFVMLAAGALLMPLLGLDSLQIGNAFGSLFLTVLVVAATATAYGVLIGSVFQTPNQALPFGAISIVILSAIGGIWVPVEILPAGLQQLAKLSPLHWALDAINELFLRSGSILTVWKQLVILLIFALLFFLIAGITESRRRR
ncbi:ABC transporter permease [Flavihumibacter sp. RY-1]|uniref:ABC transporter permease n=1 Tax=Flavihumibacter fluminis TaxID=2909236 RepID=A0ABS9BG19_9BACT|nr:ABC transporter permease [Flavihumibacter fluminis]MCF1714545.1 ABC transporter permease [Flavihumibacter fluminis]